MGSFSSPPPNRPACASGTDTARVHASAADTASFGTVFSRSQQEHTTALRLRGRAEERPRLTTDTLEVNQTAWIPAISTRPKAQRRHAGHTLCDLSRTLPTESQETRGKIRQIGTRPSFRTRTLGPDCSVKKMSLASLALGGFTMGATDGGVAKMDVSLDDIIKQV